MIKDVQRAYHRRAILTLLVYDADYRLSIGMLDMGLEATGQNITQDQIETETLWLEEQGLVRRDAVSAGLTLVSLTDRGLDIARGKARAHGIRDLRPSEITDIAGR